MNYIDDIVRKKAIVAHQQGVHSQAYIDLFEEWLTAVAELPEHRPPVQLGLTLNGIQLRLVSHRFNTYRYAPLTNETTNEIAYVVDEPPRERILREIRIKTAAKGEEVLINMGAIIPEEGFEAEEEE